MTLVNRHMPTTGCSAMVMAAGVASWAMAVGCESTTALLNSTTTADRRTGNRRMTHLLCFEQPPPWRLCGCITALVRRSPVLRGRPSMWQEYGLNMRTALYKRHERVGRRLGTVDRRQVVVGKLH